MSTEAAASCDFDADWKANCKLDLSKIGPVDIVSQLNFCSEPPLLDVILKVQRHAWKLSFLQGNSRESRTVGLEYFPLRLHVDFQKLTQFTYKIECCLETLKTTGFHCYLNSTIALGSEDLPCALKGESVNASLVVFCLLLFVSIFAIITAFLIVLRRAKRSKNGASNRGLPYVVPKLPRARFYDEVDDECSKKRHEHVPIVISSIPEETSEELREATENWRESKFVQTSCVSLDTEILILTSSNSNSSQHSSSGVDGGGRHSSEPLAESPL